MNNIFTPEFIFSLTLHITILFCILSGIFVFYISKITTSVLNNQLTRVANSLFDGANLKDLVNNSSPNAQSLVTSYLINNPQNKFPYNYYQDVYTPVDTNKERINEIVRLNILFTCIFLIVITITIGLLLFFFGDLTFTSMFSAVAENLITFIVVGGFELFFFINVILFYVPTPPSLLYNSLYGSLKDKFVPYNSPN